MKQAGRRVIMAGLALLLAGRAECGQQSFEIDLKELDAGRKAGNAPRHKAPAAIVKGKPVVRPAVAPIETEGEYHLYTVKPGDHIFKILMRDFHLSNAAAERLIPEIARVNGVTNIRRLAVGQTLRIPKSLAVAREVGSTQSASKDVETLPPAQDAAPVAMAPEPASAVQPADTAAEPPAAPPPALNQDRGRATAQLEQTAPVVPPAMAPVGSIQAITVNGGEPLTLFLRLAEVLQLSVQSNRVIESRPGTAESFSIKVPLYAEVQGKRLIVAGGGQDPFQYTLFRLLEAEGYGVLQFRETDGFREVTAATLANLGIPCRLGRYRLVNGKEQEVLGYLLTTGGRKILLTDAPVGGVWSALEIGRE